MLNSLEKANWRWPDFHCYTFNDDLATGLLENRLNPMVPQSPSRFYFPSAIVNFLCHSTGHLHNN